MMVMDESVWTDPRLDNEGLLTVALLAYLQASTQANRAGLMMLSARAAAGDLRCGAGQINKSLERLEKLEFIRWFRDERVVWLLGYAGNVCAKIVALRSALSAVRRFPRSILLEWIAAEGIAERLERWRPPKGADDVWAYFCELAEVEVMAPKEPPKSSSVQGSVQTSVQGSVQTYVQKEEISVQGSVQGSVHSSPLLSSPELKNKRGERSEPQLATRARVGATPAAAQTAGPPAGGYGVTGEPTLERAVSSAWQCLGDPDADTARRVVDHWDRLLKADGLPGVRWVSVGRHVIRAVLWLRHAGEADPAAWLCAMLDRLARSKRRRWKAPDGQVHDRFFRAPWVFGAADGTGRDGRDTSVGAVLSQHENALAAETSSPRGAAPPDPRWAAGNDLLRQVRADQQDPPGATRIATGEKKAGKGTRGKARAGKSQERPVVVSLRSGCAR